MEEKEIVSDWKTRLANYETILRAMSNPTPQLLQQLQVDLPKYLADVNPNCQKTALSICEVYFTTGTSINYPHIAHILIDKCFTTNRQGNTEAATNLLLKCISKSKEQVFNKIFDELNSKSPKVVRAMIAVLSSHLQATGNTDSASIVEHLVPLQDHRDQAIRKEASAAVALAKGAASKPIAPPSASPQRAKSPVKVQNLEPGPKPRAKSPVHKKRTISGNCASNWNSWISKETLSLLQGSKWAGVVEGLDNLKKQYADEAGSPSACLYGLTTVFIGKMFTPKVMNQLCSEILFYMKDDLQNLADDAIASCLHFVVDKITEKRLEAQIFEMADLICEIQTPPYVFSQLYAHLTAKNPQLPARIVNYFTHCIMTFGSNSKLNSDEVSEQLKPLCNHGDQSVRKSVFECIGALANVFGDVVLEQFKGLKQAQINDVRKSMNMVASSKPTSRVPLPQRGAPAVRERQVEQRPPSPRRNSPKKAKPAARKFNDASEAMIPTRLISGISKSCSVVECKKALEEIEEILGRTIEMRGSNSIPQSELAQLLSALSQWFVDGSTAVVSLVLKVVSVCLKLIRTDQIKSVAREHLGEIFLLLNYTQRPIRNLTLALLEDLQNIYPGLIEDMLLPVFTRMGIDGRKAAVIFAGDHDFEMKVEPFLAFMVNCMSDKSEEFRDLCAPLVDKYLQLPGARDAIKNCVEQYPPVKKNLIMTMIGTGPVVDSKKVFLSIPTEAQKSHRRTAVDAFVPLKIMNGNLACDALTDMLVLHGKRYFAIDFASLSASIDDIQEVSNVFLAALDANFDAMASAIDIVFLWWAQQLLMIRREDGFEVIFEFFMNFSRKLSEKRRMLDQFEVTIVLPTVLECIGRGYNGSEEVHAMLRKMTPTKVYLATLTQTVGVITSVFALQSGIDTLLSVLPTVDWDDIKSELAKTAQKLHTILSKEPSQNSKLFEKSNDLLDYLKSSGAIQTVASRPMSYCSLNPKIQSKMSNPQMLIYGWIVDLSSQDSQITLKALKSISASVKNDPNIFEPHLEAIMVSLINLIHTHFASESMNERLCKYIAFCMFSVLGHTASKSVIPRIFVAQLIYEVLTHLSNGLTNEMLNQVLNALTAKIIDDYTVFAFSGLLSALGEYDNKEQFTDKWMKLALKCFEACSVKICEGGQDDDIKESVIMLEDFLKTHPQDEIKQVHPYGPKIIAMLTSYVEVILDKFGDIVNSRDMKKRLGSNPVILDLIE